MFFGRLRRFFLLVAQCGMFFVCKATENEPTKTEVLTLRDMKTKENFYILFHSFV